MPEKEIQKDIPPPVLLSVIICDRVIIDHITGQSSIIGTLETISAPAYPARHTQLAFFCQLTNGRGKTKIGIKLVDVEKEDEPLFQNTIEKEFKDVRQVANLTFAFGGIVFPHQELQVSNLCRNRVTWRTQDYL